MKTIAVAGATGFIGRWFIQQYSKKYKIVALSRSEVKSDAYPEVEWRQVDLYSLSSTTEALKGVDYALYLVHSMQPSTRLNQGSFEDTDLLLADNFSRAAEACNLKHVIFIGGILPKETADFSTHLRSRYETEQTLGARSVPFTAIRAGIIIGPGGSSFRVVQNLVNGLPIMACPKWCKSPSQPIDVRDMLSIIDSSLGEERLFGKSIEVGGKETVSYMDLLRRTSRKMGKKRIIFSIPFFTLGFSKLWVALFSKSSRTFVSPLIESLKHDMRVKDEQSAELPEPQCALDESIEKAIFEKGPSLKRKSSGEDEKNTVRSVQRLDNIARKSAEWVADAYPKWLPSLFRYLLTARQVEEDTIFRLLGVNLLHLQYQPGRSDEDRRLFFIIGGVLAKRVDYGWLEFRSVLDNRYIIAAIHEFVPALPWTIYKYSQALMHLFVMNQFNRFLARQVKTVD
ncbi:MAG: NAD(P)H-binding protein [Bacteroidota bacterium]